MDKLAEFLEHAIERRSCEPNGAVTGCDDAAHHLFYLISERIGHDLAWQIFGKFQPPSKRKLKWMRETFVFDRYYLFRRSVSTILPVNGFGPEISVEKLAAELAAENPTRPRDLRICRGSTDADVIARYIYKLLARRKRQAELSGRKRQALPSQPKGE